MEEAERLLTEEVDLDLPSQQPVNPTFSQGLTVRGRLRLWQGDLRAARADLDVLRERGRKGFDPQVAAPLFSLLTRAATWEGELAEARAAAAQGLGLLAGCDYARFVNQLCLAGVEAEAATAEAARARRSAGQAELDRSRRVGEALLGRMRAVSAGRPGGPAAAELLTAEAEWSRVEGPGDPARWAAAVAAWDALGFPFPAAYARFRRAEALLGEGTSRAEAAPVLRRPGSAARGCEREATALARRTRVDLDPDVRPDPPPAAPSPAQQLGLTPREQEVLALVADGRTNRQIAQTLFISDKTASVHVSRHPGQAGRGLPGGGGGRRPPPPPDRLAWRQPSWGGRRCPGARGRPRPGGGRRRRAAPRAGRRSWPRRPG